MIHARWWRRARTVMPWSDVRPLLRPGTFVRALVSLAAARVRGERTHAAQAEVGARDPALVELLQGVVDAVARRYFRLRVEGLEAVPARGPVLLVGNHNGGILFADAFFTALALLHHPLRARAMYTMGHDFFFAHPALRRLALRLGVLRAGERSARMALERGHCVLVYPGADREVFRPFRERKRIVLGGRRGFVRLALRAGVPVVPVVSAGTHEQLIVVARGDRLARFLRLHRLARVDVVPLVLALPWGLAPGFVPYLPLPAQTTLAFGPPMTWPHLSPKDADRPEVVAAVYAEIEERMQHMLDELHRGRRFLLGKRT